MHSFFLRFTSFIVCSPQLSILCVCVCLRIKIYNIYIFFHIFSIVICPNDSCVFVSLSILSLFVDIFNQMENVNIQFFFLHFLFVQLSSEFCFQSLLYFIFFPCAMCNRKVEIEWKKKDPWKKDS